LLVNLAAHSTAVEIIVGIVMLAVVLPVGNVVRYIPNDQVGSNEKLWSSRGSVKTDWIAARLFEAVAQGHQPIVPQITVAGENGAAQNGLVTGHSASLLPTIRDRITALSGPGPGALAG
jgi:hypothetical protein